MKVKNIKKGIFELYEGNGDQRDVYKRQTENRSWKFVSYISSRFFKLGYYVFERRNSDAELCSNFSGSGLSYGFPEAYNPALPDVIFI